MVRTLGGLQAPGFTFRLQVQGARAAKGGVLCRAPPWPAVLGWALKVTSPCCPRSRPSGSFQGLVYWLERPAFPQGTIASGKDILGADGSRILFEVGFMLLMSGVVVAIIT